MFRQCIKCDEILPYDYFYNFYYPKKNRYQCFSSCKKCWAVYKRSWYLKNSERKGFGFVKAVPDEEKRKRIIQDVKERYDRYEYWGFWKELAEKYDLNYQSLCRWKRDGEIVKRKFYLKLG